MQPPKAIASLIKEDGSPFSAIEISEATRQLDALTAEQRMSFRNANAKAIAEHPAKKMLIVSGPGTGKSYLFLEKIRAWLDAHQDQTILVTSFVRKLVADLKTDVEHNLGDEHSTAVTVWTLHKLARSIVERNHGHSRRRFLHHLRIIAGFWQGVVWTDVLHFHPTLHRLTHRWKELENQFHNDSYSDERGWNTLRDTYFNLTTFYNAADFSDLIVAARDALEEDETLVKDELFIVDEYQDFNEAEERLLMQLTKSATRLLLVGDDDQVLYETLKSGKASLIRKLYADPTIVNALLPFCGRSDFHIVRAAHHFISHHKDKDSIEKIYLPIGSDDNASRVQMVGCATPATPVDYIQMFLEEHKSEIEQRKEELEAGTQKDSYVLILTPARQMKFLRPNEQTLIQLVEQYKRKSALFSEDYYRVLTYYSLAKYPNDNFAFRKVLHHEGMAPETVHEYLAEALSANKDLYMLEDLHHIVPKCEMVRQVLESTSALETKIGQLIKIGLTVNDSRQLTQELERSIISAEGLTRIEHEEEEEAELAERSVQEMSAVELSTIVSSKGLSADHVIIIGFDNVNMKWVTRNAFYVALTRARKSLHILTSLKSGGASAPHGFIGQLPEKHVQFGWYNKKDRKIKSFAGRGLFVNYLAWFQKNVIQKHGPEARS